MQQREAQSSESITHQAATAHLSAELGSQDLSRHLALFYRSDQSQLVAVTAFLVEGLQSGHRCVYLLDVNTAEDIKSALRRVDIDVEQRIDAGDLVIRDAEDVYLESGFDPEQMITTLETEANTSVEDGYDGLWVAGENSWCFHTEQSFDHIVDFEADFDAVCPDLPVTALCQYDLERFTEMAVSKALWTHEHIIYRNQLCKNPFHIPPEDYRSTGNPQLNAKLMLEQAHSLTTARHDIDEREQRLDVVNQILRHNIRNDLNVITGMLELIDETDSLSGESQRRLSTAIRHANSVATVAEKTRHIQQTTEDATVEPRDLDQCINTAIDNVKSNYPSANIRFSGTNGRTALADENLDVALSEAIENRITYQDTNAPVVLVSVSTPSESTVRIEIWGQGESPEPEWHPFSESEQTPLEHSNGLALWLIRWIVENANGSIEFLNSDGEEARLQIELYRVSLS